MGCFFVVTNICQRETNPKVVAALFRTPMGNTMYALCAATLDFVSGESSVLSGLEIRVRYDCKKNRDTR